MFSISAVVPCGLAPDGRSAAGRGRAVQGAEAANPEGPWAHGTQSATLCTTSHHPSSVASRSTEQPLPPPLRTGAMGLHSPGRGGSDPPRTRWLWVCGLQGLGDPLGPEEQATAQGWLSL